TNFARRQTVARNGDKYADALRESEDRVQVSVRLADGTVVNVPGLRMDLAVKFEGFDTTESFLVLDMDEYDLILGMPWLEKHEPWIDLRGKAIGLARHSFEFHACKKTSTTAEVSLSTSRVDNQVPHSDEEGAVHLEALPEVSAMLILEELSMKDFLAELKAGDTMEVILLKPETAPEDLDSSSIMEEYALEEFSDVMSKHPPSPLPPDRGCEVIDAFFAEKAKSGLVRESKSPRSTPTFCVRKPNGKWRLVHVYNKLNNATVPAQKPIPGKDVLLNNLSGCTLYSALDLVDGYYQILMRESDIPLTAVSTPGGMLWEWLVMPQGLSNDPAMFNRLVTQLFRPLRTFAQAYFDDIFVHSRAEDGQTAMEVHLKHLRRGFKATRTNKLYPKIDKRVFAAEEIKVLCCFVSRVGVRADPGKVKAIAAWPTPRAQSDLKQRLGLANYLHKYSAEYAEFARPLSDLLKKDADWKDDGGRERVISFQSRQLKSAERNYPVHDKALLAMQYALVKFRVHLLGTRPFVIYTDHASSRTATNSPHLSQRMARWLSFFAEYNFRVEFKPGKVNVLADALSRRPYYELAHASRVTTDLYDRIRLAYQRDKNYTPLQTADIESYNGEYSALIFRVEGMSMLDQMMCYTNDLKPRTRSYVKLDNPATLSAAMDLAVKYEVTHFVEDARDRQVHCGATTIYVSKHWVVEHQLQTTKFRDKNIRVKLGDNQIVQAELEVLPLEIAVSGLGEKHKCVAVVYAIPDEFDCILGIPFFEDMQPQIDWRGRKIEGTKAETLHWERTSETRGPIEEGGLVIASGLRRSVEAKGLSAKRPDSCRGAALETDVTSAVELARDTVQKESPNAVRGQHQDALAGKDTVVNSELDSHKREGIVEGAGDSGSTRGKDNVVEKMFTMGVVDEVGVQTKYITRKKLKKFLRLKTKSIDEPDFMLLLSNEIIKQTGKAFEIILPSTF
ncbi:Pol protein, partial [Phytophthora palmivora]